MVELVLVDFDDTLVDTAPRFQNARRKLFRLLIEAGFADDDIRRVHHDEVDPGMRKRFGLGPARMEPAFRATYEDLCRLYQIPIDAGLAERAAAFGRDVAGTPPVLNGAIAALQLLADALPTVLYTQSGDRDYQLGCVRDCGILDILPLERVHVTERKTTAQFQQVLAQLGVTDPANVWMIGNSMRSDINPALEAGANAILVEVTDPWEFDQVDPIADTFQRAASFSAAVDLLLALVRTCK